jgi:hypothetical protein
MFSPASGGVIAGIPVASSGAGSNIMIELNRLIETAFFAEEVVENASEALARAMQKFEQVTHTGARAFEIVVPADADEPWVRDQVHRLVYFCESEGMPVPECGGTIVALYIGRWMYGIAGGELVRWASGVLSAVRRHHRRAVHRAVDVRNCRRRAGALGERRAQRVDRSAPRRVRHPRDRDCAALSSSPVTR